MGMVHVQLALDDQCTGSHNLALVFDDQKEIAPVALCVHPVVPLIPLFLRDISNRRQDAQAVEEATGEVVLLQCPDGV